MGAGEAKVGERAQRKIEHDAAMVNHLLKLLHY
jgi:hypothetical protein